MSGQSWFSGTTASEEALKFLQQLENDLRNLSLELKKKYPNPREVSFGWKKYKQFHHPDYFCSRARRA
jgi:hypothetical protein